jgi:hypothetical protein
MLGCNLVNSGHAVNAPERKVMMLDPSPTNVKTAKEKYGALKNLEILPGGIILECVDSINLIVEM